MHLNMPLVVWILNPAEWDDTIVIVLHQSEIGIGAGVGTYQLSRSISTDTKSGMAHIKPLVMGNIFFLFLKEITGKGQAGYLDWYDLVTRLVWLVSSPSWLGQQIFFFFSKNRLRSMLTN